MSQAADGRLVRRVHDGRELAGGLHGGKESTRQGFRSATEMDGSRREWPRLKRRMRGIRGRVDLVVSQTLVIRANQNPNRWILGSCIPKKAQPKRKEDPSRWPRRQMMLRYTLAIY